MPFTQNNRAIKIQIQNLGPDDLLLTAVTGQEAMSRPFSYRVEMLCEDLNKEFKPADMIGASATIGVKLRRDSNEYRFRSGFIRSFQTGNVHRDFRVFRAEIVPFLTFLQLSTDFRIFQNLTVVDILQQVFDDFGLNDLDMRVQSSDFPKLEYCVQCRETAFDFVSRLMEENGIFYFFEHSEAGHTLVLTDKLSDYKTCEQSNVGLSREDEEGRISIFEHGFDFRTGKWTLGDFSYGTPAKPPFDDENTRSEIPKPNPHERYTFPQHFRVSEDARRFVTRLEHCALTWLADRHHGDADATVTLERDVLTRLVLRELSFADVLEQGLVSIDGDPARVVELFSLLDDFPLMFDVVEPRRAGAGPRA